jgi:hypothetical protein
LKQRIVQQFHGVLVADDPRGGKPEAPDVRPWKTSFKRRALADHGGVATPLQQLGRKPGSPGIWGKPRPDRRAIVQMVRPDPIRHRGDSGTACCFYRVVSQ